MSVPSLTPYVNDASAVTLEDWGPLPEATGSPMATSGVTLWEQGTSSAGIWQCTAGPSYWKLETHEVIHVVAGWMTVTADDGSALDLKAGDVAVFPRGWTGTWDIHETVRKVFAVFE